MAFGSKIIGDQQRETVGRLSLNAVSAMLQRHLDTPLLMGSGKYFDTHHLKAVAAGNM
jgi:hypothetical protein